MVERLFGTTERHTGQRYIQRVFERIKPQELSESLNSWLKVERESRAVIAIDGKTICGSGNKEHKPYHVVSAFVAENQITLGELAVDEKSNEITAVPELLDMIDIENCIVTADAMSCQKKIVQKITDQKADYVIGLKENQSALYQDTALYFNPFRSELDSCRTLDKGHGRGEKREYYLLTDMSWLPTQNDWSNLNGLGMVHSLVIENDQIRGDRRYFITSLTNVQEFAYAVRKHWAIENQLHRCLDVIFREDSARAKKDHSPLNMNILRKTALSLLNHAKYGRLSCRKLMFKAALNPDSLLRILFNQIIQK